MAVYVQIVSNPPNLWLQEMNAFATTWNAKIAKMVKSSMTVGVLIAAIAACGSESGYLSSDAGVDADADAFVEAASPEPELPPSHPYVPPCARHFKYPTKCNPRYDGSRDWGDPLP